MSTKRFVTMRRVRGGKWEAADHFDEFADALAELEEGGAIIDIDAPAYRAFWRADKDAYGWERAPDDVRLAFEAREF